MDKKNYTHTDSWLTRETQIGVSFFLLGALASFAISFGFYYQSSLDAKDADFRQEQTARERADELLLIADDQLDTAEQGLVAARSNADELVSLLDATEDQTALAVLAEAWRAERNNLDGCDLDFTLFPGPLPGEQSTEIPDWYTARNNELDEAHDVLTDPEGIWTAALSELRNEVRPVIERYCRGVVPLPISLG